MMISCSKNKEDIHRWNFVTQHYLVCLDLHKSAPPVVTNSLLSETSTNTNEFVFISCKVFQPFDHALRRNKRTESAQYNLMLLCP